MASRPFAFGVRLRDKGRTVRVRARNDDPRRYVVEESRQGRRPRSREHESLQGALRHLAASWRARLH